MARTMKDRKGGPPEEMRQREGFLGGQNPNLKYVAIWDDKKGPPLWDLFASEKKLLWAQKYSS